MVLGLFNNLQISSQKLLRSIEEARNDAAEFFLLQLFPQAGGYIGQSGTPASSPFDQVAAYYQNQIRLNNSAALASNGISPIASSNNIETNSNFYNNRQAVQVQQMNDFNIGLLQQQQQPQFIFDPTGNTTGFLKMGSNFNIFIFKKSKGQYILCQSGGWQ